MGKHLPTLPNNECNCADSQIFATWSPSDGHLSDVRRAPRFPDSVKMNTELKLNCSYLAMLSEVPAFTDMDQRNRRSLTVSHRTLPSRARAAVLSREEDLGVSWEPPLFPHHYAVLEPSLDFNPSLNCSSWDICIFFLLKKIYINSLS